MSFESRTQPILEAAIAALNIAHNDLYTTGDGLSDTVVGAITSPGTVTKLLAKIDAIPFKSRNNAMYEFIRSSIVTAAEPIFRMAGPLVTSATPAGSGGSLADGDYKIVVTAFDALGRETAVSSELSATAAAGGTDSIPVVIPAMRGAVKFRVYFTAVGGAAGAEDRYKESAATAGITSSSVTVTITTTTVAGAVVSGTPPTAAAAAAAAAGYGYISDIDVELGRAAGLFSTLRNAVADQHPLGTDARELTGMHGNHAYVTNSF